MNIFGVSGTITFDKFFLTKYLAIKGMNNAVCKIGIKYIRRDEIY